MLLKNNHYLYIKLLLKQYDNEKTLLSLIALFFTTIAFAYDVEIDGIYYNLDNENKTAEVTKDENTFASYSQPEITIPASISYNNETYSVTSIGKQAFYFSSTNSITIPNSVTEIGWESFIIVHLLPLLQFLAT